MKIYVNKETGALAVLCCGELGDASFKELKANHTDAAQEKLGMLEHRRADLFEGEFFRRFARRLFKMLP